MTNCEDILSTNTPSIKHAHPYQRCARVVRPGTTVLIRWCTQIRRPSWERGKSGICGNNRGLVKLGITELKTQRYRQSQRTRSKPLTLRNVSNDFSWQLSPYKQRHTCTIQSVELARKSYKYHNNVTREKHIDISCTKGYRVVSTEHISIGIFFSSMTYACAQGVCVGTG